jgi:hypothetical protein
VTRYLKWLIAQAAGDTPAVRPRHWPRLYAPVGSHRDGAEPVHRSQPSEIRSPLSPPLPQMNEITTPPEPKREARKGKNATTPPPTATATSATVSRLPDIESSSRQPGSDSRDAPPQANSDTWGSLPHKSLKTMSLQEIVERLVAPVSAASSPLDPPVNQSQPSIVQATARPQAHEKHNDIAHTFSRDHARSPDSPSVTNIHIGRVELRAIASPQASRKAAPSPVKTPMSLEEYLRLRNGRSQ